jgi:hypothetical protein
MLDKRNTQGLESQKNRKIEIFGKESFTIFRFHIKLTSNTEKEHGYSPNS